MGDEGEGPGRVGRGRMALFGTVIRLQRLAFVSVRFFVAFPPPWRVGTDGGRRRSRPFFGRRPATALFPLDRRPSLLTIPPTGGLPCGGGFLREGGLHGFLCPPVPDA